MKHASIHSIHSSIHSKKQNKNTSRRKRSWNWKLIEFSSSRRIWLFASRAGCPFSLFYFFFLPQCSWWRQFPFSSLSLSLSLFSPLFISYLNDMFCRHFICTASFIFPYFPPYFPMSPQIYWDSLQLPSVFSLFLFFFSSPLSPLAHARCCRYMIDLVLSSRSFQSFVKVLVQSIPHRPSLFFPNQSTVVVIHSHVYFAEMTTISPSTVLRSFFFFLQIAIA